MIDLTSYGWNDRLDLLKRESAHPDLVHGRVAVVHRSCCGVVSGNGLFQCELTGTMLYGKRDDELPCTGDWVIFRPFADGRGIIVDMLPRERTLYRKKSGTAAGRQAIASHVDKAFIVQSLDENFNVRRAERFMIQILEADINPVLLLNKADLPFDRRETEEAVKHLARRMPVFFTSIRRPETVAELRESIREGETVVFVGSSGVGKSSLVNALCGNPVLRTSHISRATGKGRHTSTRREMVLMDGAGVLIDTPGVREFGLALDNPDSLAEALDIPDYAELCRFKDCTHTSEPGCAVLEAVRQGTLDAGAYENYLKLKREALHFSSSEHERRQRDKSFSKLVEGVKRRKEKH